MNDRNESKNRSQDPPPPRASDWLRLAIPILLVGGFIAIAWKLGYFDLKHPAKLNRAAETAQSHPWFGVAYVAAYAVIAAFAAPVSPLAYAAGAMFGVMKGTLLVMAGSLLGATAGYWLAHGVWSHAARRLLGRYHDKLDDLRERSPFLTALRLQLLPIVPFGVFNYAAGATRIGFAGFLAGTTLGILPGSVAAAYVGERIAAGIQGSDKSAFIVAGAVMLALLALSFVPTLLRKRKQKHRRR